MRFKLKSGVPCDVYVEGFDNYLLWFGPEHMACAVMWRCGIANFEHVIASPGYLKTLRPASHGIAAEIVECYDRFYTL